MKKIMIVAALFLGAGVVMHASTNAQEEILLQKDCHVSQPINVHLECCNGTVELTPSHDDQLHATVTVLNNQPEITVSAVGPENGTFKVVVNEKVSISFFKWLWSFVTGRGVWPRITVKASIPAQQLRNVSLRATNGPLTLSGFDHTPIGLVSLVTTNGSITVDHVATADEIEIETTNGGIVVTECAGAIGAHTVNGGIAAENNRGGNLRATTVNGYVTVTGHTGGSVRATTVNGEITLDNPQAKSEEGNSTSGSVRKISSKN